MNEAEIIKIIKSVDNFYPKDIYVWDNSEEITLTRGRFNQHCYKIIELFRNKILREIKEANEE